MTAAAVAPHRTLEFVAVVVAGMPGDKEIDCCVVSFGCEAASPKETMGVLLREGITFSSNNSFGGVGITLGEDSGVGRANRENGEGTVTMPNAKVSFSKKLVNQSTYGKKEKERMKKLKIYWETK